MILTTNQKVVGSNPAGLTIEKPCESTFTGFFFFCFSSVQGRIRSKNAVQNHRKTITFYIHKMVKRRLPDDCQAVRNHYCYHASINAIADNSRSADTWSYISRIIRSDA